MPSIKEKTVLAGQDERGTMSHHEMSGSIVDGIAHLELAQSIVELLSKDMPDRVGVVNALKWTYKEGALEKMVGGTCRLRIKLDKPSNEVHIFATPIMNGGLPDEDRIHYATLDIATGKLTYYPGRTGSASLRPIGDFYVNPSVLAFDGLRRVPLGEELEKIRTDFLPSAK